MHSLTSLLVISPSIESLTSSLMGLFLSLLIKVSTPVVGRALKRQTKYLRASSTTPAVVSVDPVLLSGLFQSGVTCSEGMSELACLFLNIL